MPRSLRAKSILVRQARRYAPLAFTYATNDVQMEVDRRKEDNAGANGVFPESNEASEQPNLLPTH